MPRGARMCMLVHVCACVHVCAHVCPSVISGFKHPLRIFTNPLYTRYLYTHHIAFIFVMWDYLSFYIFVRDMAHSKSSDRCELI